MCKETTSVLCCGVDAKIMSYNLVGMKLSFDCEAHSRVFLFSSGWSLRRPWLEMLFIMNDVPGCTRQTLHEVSFSLHKEKSPLPSNTCNLSLLQPFEQSGHLPKICQKSGPSKDFQLMEFGGCSGTSLSPCYRKLFICFFKRFSCIVRVKLRKGK